MKKTALKVLWIFVCTVLLLSSVSLPLAAVEADPQNPENRMAYNIYAVPQFGDIPNAFSAYSMDFYVENGAPMTYWAFANFNMHISEKTKEKYPGITGGGAYAGVQTHGENNPRKAVLAFWEWEYTLDDGMKTNLFATRVYPQQDDFFGDDYGTNAIVNYQWQDKHWYRLMLYTWENKDTGTTMCGFWIGDLKNDTWTLVSVFDTKMYDSYLEGNMNFFMENFVGGEPAGIERDFRIKNIAVCRYDTGEWVTIDTMTIRHCNNWANNKIGKHSFGATEEYFWGKAGGYLTGGESQEQHDADWPEKTFTLKNTGAVQLPDKGGSAPILNRVQLRHVDGAWRIRWDPTVKGGAILSYSVIAKDREGKELYSKTAVDPSVARVEMEQIGEDCFYVDFEVTDMFGNTAKYRAYTDDYVEKYGETMSVDTPEPSLPQSQGDDGAPSTLVMAVIAACAVALIVVVAAVTVKNKNKE